MTTDNLSLASSELLATASITFDLVYRPEAGINEDEEPLSSSKSKSELLAVLPHQHFSESDGVLDLTFSLYHGEMNCFIDEMREPQVSVKLVVDSAPGCGGIAWPAGQVRPLFVHRDYNQLGAIML